jgi:hypothetical protein
MEQVCALNHPKGEGIVVGVGICSSGNKGIWAAGGLSWSPVPLGFGGLPTCKETWSLVFTE